MKESDENLMMAVRDGEVTKLGVLFDRYHRTLFDFFIRMTGSRMAADDLVQDVFFRILKYRRTFRDEGSFKAWMFHIARNARFDYFRSHQADSPSDEKMEDFQSPAPFPGLEFEQRQQAFILQCAMFKLSPEKREVLILSRYQEMKYEQIAELMGCELGTVKTRVHRAIKELRDIFLQLSGEKKPCDVKKSSNSLRMM